jgi:two-component system sensor histidine kinase KdpD
MSEVAHTFPAKSVAAYALAAGIVVACTLAGYALESVFNVTDIIMFYLAGVMITAVRLGRRPSLFCSFLSVAAFDFFFVDPRYTFAISDFHYSLTFLAMFATGFVISDLAARLRDQMLLARRREHEAQVLYELMKELADAGTRDDMSVSLIHAVQKAIGAEAAIRYADGALFGILPKAGGMDIPLRGMDRELGTVTLPGEGLADDQKIMLQSCAGLLGAALARAETAQAAQQAKILAEKEKIRSILLSSVSHDLRSPLAAITGAADTLLKSLKDDPLLQSIRQEAARVTRIISNLLDITRIEGGHVKLNMRAYDPAEIIGSAVTACAETMKGHELTLNVAPDLPFVRMDGLLISQLIQNLLENAARHTPKGTQVELNAYIREGSLCLIVADNGPGIEKGKEQEIFSKFATYVQGDRPKGAGLGLAICNAIVTAHHGRIYAQNQPEGGARFVVELPPDLTLPKTAEAANAE